MRDNDDVSKQETPDAHEPLTMEQMGGLLEANLNIDFAKAGESRDGIIASIGDNQVLVSVGAKSERIMSGREYESIPAAFLLTMAVGQAIPVYVVTPEDQNGNLVLSFIRAVEEQSWLDAEEMKASGVSFESEIVGYNKGGLLVPLSTIRGFIPASQLSLSRRSEITGETPEEKYKAMIGEKVQCCVIEVDRERHRLILSERAASTETRDMVREKILDSLKEGDVRTGRVTSLADFGAFVNIGGADGLVHVSEISYDRITHPSEALKVGDEVKVKIISIDKERRRIGLSIRQLQNDPWSTQVNALKVGQLVEGEITRLTNFGAFAKLNIPGDMEGLIHISGLSDKRVDHPKEILKVGDRVALRILRIEEENRRIGLSMRRVDSPQYADQDWKSLAQDLDVVSSSSGEALGDIVGEISQSLSAAAPDESAPAEESPVEAAPEESAPVEESPVEAAPEENAPVEESPAEETPSAEEPQA